MNALSHPYLLGFGALLLVVGFLLWRWSSRHDLKGMAIDAAWQVAKARGDIRTETELGSRLKEFATDGSNISRAKKATGYAVRHALAQIASIASLLMLLGGAGLIAAALFLK